MIKPFLGNFLLTQTFAEHEHWREQNGWQYYNGGLDWALPEQTAIYAAMDGKISKVETLNTGYGNVVKIDHENGLQTLYAHLAYIVVGLDQVVAQGQMIGRSGNTGNSTGPHLHFEVRRDGIAIDPQPMLDVAEYTPVKEYKADQNTLMRVVAEYGANVRLTPQRSNNLVATLPKGTRVQCVSGIVPVLDAGLEWVAVQMWMARSDEDGTELLV